MSTQADDHVSETGTQQLPPLSARAADPDIRLGKVSFRPGAKVSNKLPRTPSVKQLLGQLEASLKSQFAPVPEDQSNGSILKQSTSAASLSTGKMAPAEVQECLRNVSMAFGEVIERLPSYRQLLIKVQETYDRLVSSVLEELYSTTNLRSRLKVLSAQLQRLEGGHHFFPAENSWAEACKLRRLLNDRNLEHQTLEDEHRKLQDKVAKQTAELRGLHREGFKHRRKTADLEAMERESKNLLKHRSQALAEKRWSTFITWAIDQMPEPAGCNDTNAASSDSETDMPGSSQVLADLKSASPAQPSPLSEASSGREKSLLRRRSTMIRRLSLPPELCVLPLDRLPPEQPVLMRLESSASTLSKTMDIPSPSSDAVDLASVVQSLVVNNCPEKWGISLKQLHDFWDEIKDDMHDYCEDHNELMRGKERFHICLKEDCAWQHFHAEPEPLSKLSCKERSRLTPLAANMHLVVNRYIKPQTETCNKSYALMKNPKGRKINIFITHVWSDRFKNFVHTLRRALSDNDVVWVCSFAMPQNSTDEIQALLDTKDLRDCPFGVALRHAESHVVILDDDAVVPTRSWCTYEINLGSNLNKPMLLWPHQMHNFDQLHERIELLNMETASASRKEDEERIKADIRQMGGFEALNKRLRGLLHDRIRFAQDIVVAGKQDREGIMHAFKQKLAKEEEDHRNCQLELAELSHKLQAALDSGNSKLVGEVCQATQSLKMDEKMKACWEGIQKLHMMLEYQPLKADATPVHAMQIMCNSLVRIHRESLDEFGDVDWGKTFSRAFERELEKKGLVNIREDVVKFIAQIKPPCEFSAFFLPECCWETWEKFGLRHAQEKANQLVDQRSIAEDRRLFQDRLSELDDAIAHEIRPSPDSSPGLSPNFDPFAQRPANLTLLQENHCDVMRMLEVLTRIHSNTELSDRAHRDELEKREVARKLMIEDFKAEIQKLEESKERAVCEARHLERQLGAETVEERILELRKEMSRTMLDRDDSRVKLVEMQTQQRRLESKVEELSDENEAMKEEVRKNQALAEYWQQQEENHRHELQQVRATAKNFRNSMNEAKMESMILKLRPEVENKTPSVAMRSLCTALVRAADDYHLRMDWYECFQEFFKLSMKDIPSQKEDIEKFICHNGGHEFQSRFLSYRSSSRRRSMRKLRTAKSKEKLGEVSEEIQNIDVISDWDEEDERPSSAPELVRKKTLTLSSNGALNTVPKGSRKLAQRKTTPRLYAPAN